MIIFQNQAKAFYDHLPEPS